MTTLEAVKIKGVWHVTIIKRFPTQAKSKKEVEEIAEENFLKINNKLGIPGKRIYADGE